MLSTLTYALGHSSTTRNCLLFFVLLSCLLFQPADAVKRNLFKTCEQSGFCNRNRAYADAATQLASLWESPYELDATSIALSDGQLTATVIKYLRKPVISDAGGSNDDSPSDAEHETVQLPLTISFLETGTARVTVDEDRRRRGDIQLRHESKVRKERYNEAAGWVLVGGLELSKEAVLDPDTDPETTRVRYGPASRYEAIIHHRPFSVDFKRDGQLHIRLNERGLLNVEHWRAKLDKPPHKNEELTDEPHQPSTLEVAEDESTWWEEFFSGHQDSKPKGPESVALDVSFIGYDNIYGIPEHASSMALKETRGGAGNYDDPYRLYNLDVFEYEMDSPMALYGSIPLMQAHRGNASAAVFWLNVAETWIDVVKSKASSNPFSLGTASRKDIRTHWISETGLIDLFIILGEKPQDISQKYGQLTGYQQLPQASTIAYHQCRWNYVSDEDVADVAIRFDRHNIPFDVIWLDIEYTDEKKYFTFDPHTFPKPLHMQKDLEALDRKLVVIIDPHIKNTDNYDVVDYLKEHQYAIMDKDGNQFVGHCWPGSSYWIDTFNRAARTWWKTLFKYDKFIGTAPNSFLWNDMNEPSVFNGPETTSPKDNIHHGDWEHRDVHNLYGMTFHNATYEALIERKKGENRRPFVLIRSFFAGSQRLGATWTGDNAAEWSHLAASFPMILNNGISGFPFVGADVGGFFGNPSKELLTRWYQAGAFYPFFRAHAHIDSRRREPYVIGTPHTEIITHAIRLRYALLPAWYTAFHEASTTGAPILRPNFYVHPGDERGATLDDQFYLGSTGLLVKPIVTEGAESVDIYLADDELYYDYFGYTVYTGGRVYKTIEAPLTKIPILMQGGHIFPRRDRPRRSSGLMRYDPFTLVVVLGRDGHADGTLYMDDGDTHDYKHGAFIHRHFVFDRDAGTLVSSVATPSKGPKAQRYLDNVERVRLEKVIVVGAPNDWRHKEAVEVSEEGHVGGRASKKAELNWYPSAEGRAAWAVVKDPGLKIGRTWTIDFNH